jgi:hypothetical protein
VICLEGNFIVCIRCGACVRELCPKRSTGDHFSCQNQFWCCCVQVFIILHSLLFPTIYFCRLASQISLAKTTGSNDRYENYEWNFVNTTEYLTIIGPSPARTFTLPPMMCFIVTFTPSNAPAGMGFQLNYTFAAVEVTPTPTPPPNAAPSDEEQAASGSKVGWFSFFVQQIARKICSLLRGPSHSMCH